MSLLIHTDQLLQRATAILPFSNEDIIYKGIAVGLDFGQNCIIVQ